MNSTVIFAAALSFFLASCGGHTSGEEENPFHSPDAPDNTSGVNFVVGGAISGPTCFAALSAIKSSQVRKNAACELARLAYLDAGQVSFNTEYLATGADYIGSSSKHTGVDLQGHPKPSGSRIGAVAKGIVVGINQRWGLVVVRAVVDGTPIQIGYMHLKDIAVLVGQEVFVGTPLGYEGGMGPQGVHTFPDHLHIEMRTNDIDPGVTLSTLPNSPLWSYALDPLDFADRLFTVSEVVPIGGIPIGDPPPSGPVSPAGFGVDPAG